MAKKSKGDNSTKNIQQTLSNLRQQNAFNEIVNNYDTGAIRILNEAQQEVNDKQIELRQKTQHEFKDIETETNNVLRKAHIESEVHIVERHLTSSLFFYHSGSKLMMSSKQNTTVLKLQDAKDKNKFNDLILDEHQNAFIRVTPYIYDSSAQNAIATLIIGCYSDNVDDTNLTFYNLIFSNNTAYLIEIKSVEDTEKRYDAWFSPTEDLYALMSGSNVKLHAPKRFTDVTSTKFASTMLSGLPRFAASDGSNVLNYYFIDKGSIKSIIHADTLSGIRTEISSGQTGLPVDVAYYSSHHTLFVQDLGKREIGLNLLETNETDVSEYRTERFWRSFQKQSFIQLPKQVFQSDENFTISFLLKRHNQTELVNEGPTNASPFKIWVDKKTFHFSYRVNETERYYSAGLTEQFHVDNNSDWFQFAMQKEKNQIRFFAGENQFFTVQADDFPPLKGQEVRLCMPGYLMCELRIWKTIRSGKQLKQYSKTWLPLTEFDGLMGYWHLFVTGEDKTGFILKKLNADGVIEIVQEPDLSGNKNHMVTQKDKSPAVGDLNYHTLISGTAAHPFPKVIPLYTLKMNRQGIDVDDNTGKIYWVDEGDDGRIYLMEGSVLGHLPAIQLFEIDAISIPTVLSQVNSTYENLLLAHAGRRNAMEKQVMAIVEAFNAGHETIQSLHKDVGTKINKLLTSNSNNAAEIYAQVHKEWLEALAVASEAEEQAINVASKMRNHTLEEVRKITDDAQRRVMQVMRTGGSNT